MSAAGRFGGALSALFWGAAADATSLLPPKWRYAYVHPITRKTLGRGIRSVPAAIAPARVPAPVPEGAGETDTVCAIVTDKLDVGGIGSVVEMLVDRLPAHGVRPVVVCQGDGPRAARLRARGIRVLTVADGETRITAVQDAGADVVQVHSAPPLLEDAAIAAGLPLVPVLHNTEIHYPPAQWERFARLLDRSATAVAVSRVVADFHARHVPAALRDRFTVVPNGAATVGVASPEDRATARAALGDALGADLADDVVFVCLARYDAQKNIAGMVASFLGAIPAAGTPVRLVVAGEPSDWVEYRRADGIRRRSSVGDRVHLLGNSDAATLLAAADVFLLDSFFEGWPMAATEALGAGLPLVLSDVGGARELVARDPERSILIPNAVGEADAVTDALVGRERRRSTRQDNATALAAAVRRAAEGVVRRRAEASSPPVADGGADAMAAAHAEIIHAVRR